MVVVAVMTTMMRLFLSRGMPSVAERAWQVEVGSGSVRGTEGGSSGGGGRGLG